MENEKRDRLRARAVASVYAEAILLGWTQEEACCAAAYADLRLRLAVRK